VMTPKALPASASRELFKSCGRINQRRVVTVSRKYVKNRLKKSSFWSLFVLFLYRYRDRGRHMRSMNAMAIVEGRWTSGLMTGAMRRDTIVIRKVTWTRIKNPISLLKLRALITSLNTRPPRPYKTMVSTGKYVLSGGVQGIVRRFVRQACAGSWHYLLDAR